MKKGIHPAYHFVNVQLNDGSTYRTRTTYGEADQKVTLDIDPTTHPAWTGGQQRLLDTGGYQSGFSVLACLAAASALIACALPAAPPTTAAPRTA